ncbi:hypothetical protein GCM10025881_01460 [Pseudolysinimonas kribbensis]|uniref:HTH hxlR-type domain-containing protein n=1 Tax=Pseudolysinimonas kribbensis TaxID=433641 RepID=A0ABQ6K062_9MICO|nr:hypothetical protein GCM10025881_01460 [Pseudolysinimonas kribbensis]
MAARDYGQYDGITRALELAGERWALLIVRDLLVGPRRYGELAAGLPRIPSNILAARLKELQEAGIIRRAPDRASSCTSSLPTAASSSRSCSRSARGASGRSASPARSRSSRPTR